MVFRISAWIPERPLVGVGGETPTMEDPDMDELLQIEMLEPVALVAHGWHRFFRSSQGQQRKVL